MGENSNTSCADVNINNKNGNKWLKTCTLATTLGVALLTLFLFVVRAETGRADEKVDSLRERTDKIENALDKKVSTVRFDDMNNRLNIIERDIKEILRRLPEK